MTSNKEMAEKLTEKFYGFIEGDAYVLATFVGDWIEDMEDEDMEDEDMEDED